MRPVRVKSDTGLPATGRACRFVPAGDIQLPDRVALAATGDVGSNVPAGLPEDEKMNRRRFLQGSISAATAFALPTASRAQQYPTKLMRYLVGFPPGGSADLTMRQFAFRLDAVLGAKNVIENVAGASSTLAALQAVRAEPDGHKLYLGSNVSQVIAPVMLKLSYDPLTALAPISQMTTSSSLVAVSTRY